jgi:hypothetical protein
MGMAVRVTMPMMAVVVIVIVIMGFAWHARIIPIPTFSTAIRLVCREGASEMNDRN